MRERSFTVRASTTGTPAPGLEHIGKWYRYEGRPGWPADPATHDQPGAKTPLKGYASREAGRRQQRIAACAAALAEICDAPEDATPEQVRRAGAAAGVGERTAREYRTALLRREEGAQ